MITIDQNCQLFCGDCLEVMKQIPDKSIDMILCDLPYGTTHCKWDSVIDLDLLWAQYKRIIKSNGAIVLNAQQPFSAKLVMSNPDWFKYAWIWKKNRCPNFMMAKYAPLKTTEDILVFSAGGVNQNTKNKMIYNPQGIKSCKKAVNSNVKKQGVNIYNCLNKSYTQTTTGYPTNIIEFACESGQHPTQKPVAMCEYLIKTYTNEGDVVLDNCMGSGTTGVACRNLRRKFIGIELDEKYFKTAENRIKWSLL
jgi:site-specific DNA-methyltransferase (adenine-specific)